MAFWNFNAPMPMFGWNGANHGAARDSGVAAAGQPSGMQQLLQQLRGGRGPVPAAPSSGGPAAAPGGGPARRRRTRQGRLRSPSSSPSLPETDQTGEALRLSLANEMDDRFARLRSNQHLAPTTKRTGPVHFEEIPSLMDERVAAERALVDRYVRILETAVKEGIPEADLAGGEHEMRHELRLWRDRVKQEKLDNADLRAYLLARRESLCGVHANLTSALAEVKTAKDMVFAPRCPPVHPPARVLLSRALHG
ncbi:hypothetical protein PRIPAC_74982 [Pristionchus pacificus]|uniref:Uncharacterized protein n=1 Tax=Pristionchus pacificus TaxID=54126 RepID=A0A2A6B576_PRIPA|nr:hypothetical protein PRIPAC_74982 [Pristionchus pacificus]|eukprot:PDM61029.1 hypothetical protein PRIPAC_54835 [Pristionchus pacificus]